MMLIGGWRELRAYWRGWACRAGPMFLHLAIRCRVFTEADASFNRDVSGGVERHCVSAGDHDSVESIFPLPAQRVCGLRRKRLTGGCSGSRSAGLRSGPRL